MSNEKLQRHSIDCGEMNKCAVILPTDDDKWLSFRSRNRRERLPFVVYADMECLLERQAFDDTANTYSYQRHRPYSVGYYIKCASGIEGFESVYKFRRNEDCVSWFVDEIKKFAERVRVSLVSVKEMRALTDIELYDFLHADRCYICEQPFAEDATRVRDHCHFTGRYRGPAHSGCNLNYRNAFMIPVFFHNLAGYDAHFIIERIANAFEGAVHLLPLTKEKYIAFTKQMPLSTDRWKWQNVLNIRFVDSFKFLSESLDKLSSYLERDTMNILRAEFAHLSDTDFALLTRKGVFPYEYVDSTSRLADTVLPSRPMFYSSLTGEMVSESQYEHAQNVWRCFRVENLGEYSDLYLKTDVLLLADVFENFRDRCLDSYDLDPAYYYTLPGYTWDAMLKYTGVRLELLTDIDKLLFVERGIRGGLSQCSCRYALANNIYAPRYTATKPSTYLMYYDVNNLYGWAMCEPLPRADFEWVTDTENFDVMSVPADGPTGYILEVDLAYPRDLHDSHSDLPFCPVHEVPPGKRSSKLLATLRDKTRYVIHYRNLQQCLSHGLRLIRIHRVLRFSQCPWLRGYIELNTEFRKRAINEFEKNMFKLMNNAVFGKTMENVREHVDVRLVTRWDGRYGAEAMISKPNFHSRSIFSENLMAVELRRLEVKINKPVYVGMCVLEISKTCMYEFHYDYMKPLYDDKCKILYTDTDSLVYHIACDSVYECVKRDIARFDTSDYPPDNVYGIPRENKKVPGLMKDENNGEIMTEFVGLRAKMYAYRVRGRADTKRIKGIRKAVVAREITFDDYVECLVEAKERSKRQCAVRSVLHNVYTVSELKLALSPHDDKRCVVLGSHDTLPWGHYSLAESGNREDA